MSLVEQRALREDLQAALSVMVEKHLEVHGHDAQKSLQSLSSLGTAQQVLQQVGDAEVQASLVHWSTASSGDPAAPSPQQATTLGLPTSAGSRFRILRPHAKGGLGQVFVAHDEELHREVALKEIQEHSADNPVARIRFQLEAEITGGLEHPGIVPVYGLGHYPDGRPFYAMRFIRGDSLKDACTRFHAAGLPIGGLEFRQLLGRFVDVCNAIAYAHSRGVLHRDLKPGNIMLGKYGETLVVDWGVAKAGVSEPSTVSEEGALLPPSGRDTSSKTMAGTAVGTPAFMSPEQAAGRLDLVGPASDIYSLGATLYVLLTGTLPFADKDSGEVLQKVQRGDFAPPRQIKPDVPAPLAAVCGKAMALRPQDRYTTPLELAADIESWLADEPVRAWPEPATVRLGRWMRKHKPVVSGMAAALAVGVIAASVGTVWFQTERAQRETERALRDAEEQVREAEAARKRGLAELAIHEALDQATKMHTELHAVLREPGGVFTLLNEPARWQAQVHAASASVEGARAILANATELLAHGDAQQRVQQLEELIRRDDTDRLLALALEKIRMDRSAISRSVVRAVSSTESASGDSAIDLPSIHDDDFDNAGAARAYPRAFAEAGLAIHDADTKQTGGRIAASAIKETLVAALDDWAGIALRFKQDGLVEQLLAVARHADPDPKWHDRVRRLKVLRDSSALAALANTTPAVRLSPGMLSLIVHCLPKNSPERESLLKNGLIQFPREFWLNLQIASDLQSSNLVEAIGFARTAVAVRPHSAAAYNNLANMLGKQGRVAEAVSAYEKALEIEPRSATMYTNLSGTLRDHGRLKEALAAVEKALILNPRFAKAHNNHGTVLGDMNRPEESLAAQERAVELDPSSAESQNNLGAALREVGRVDEAIAAYHKAIKINPKYATAYSNLGFALHTKGLFAESAAACEKAIEHNPKFAIAHNHLGMALDDLNRHDEAIAAFRRAIELQPKLAEAHYNLGLTLQKQKRTDEAVAAFQKSVAITPNLPHRQGALGRSLLQQGSFADALTATQKALDLLPAKHSLRALVSRQLRECQRAVTLESQLAEVIDKNAPAAAVQLLELAQFCQTYKHRYPTALRLYRQAFAQEPSLLDDLVKQPRYNAACAAALAGLGSGPLSAKLPEVERVSLRRQARDWLQADLDIYMKQIREESVNHLIAAEDRLRYWQSDADFIGVRDAKELAKLPEAERRPWQTLWADVEQTLKVARSRFRETRHQGVLSPKETSQVHPLKVSATTAYVFDLESLAFDTILKIEDAQGKPLAENDDIGNGNLNSRIVFQPEFDAAVWLRVTSYQQRGVGGYTLHIREFVPKKR